MKVVLQRVLSASVSVDGVTCGSIGLGYLLLVGIAAGDDESTVRRLVADVAKARLMPDSQGKMGVNLRDAGGEASSRCWRTSPKVTAPRSMAPPAPKSRVPCSTISSRNFRRTSDEPCRRACSERTCGSNSSMTGR